MPEPRPRGTLEGNPEGWSKYIVKLELALSEALERERVLRAAVAHVIDNSAGTPSSVKQYLRDALSTPAPPETSE